MVRPDHQLSPLVATDMLGQHLTLVEDADRVAVGADRDRPASELRRCRIAVAVELDPRMGTDDRGHDLVGVQRDRRQRAQPRALTQEAIDRPLFGRLMEPHVGHLVTPQWCQSQVVLEARQLRPTAGQGVVLDVAHGPLDDPFGFRVASFASDRLQAEVTAQRQELGMETGGAARAVEDGGFQVVDDQGAGTAAEELQGVHHAAIELGLACDSVNSMNIRRL